MAAIPRHIVEALDQSLAARNREGAGSQRGTGRGRGVGVPRWVPRGFRGRRRGRAPGVPATQRQAEAQSRYAQRKQAKADRLAERFPAVVGWLTEHGCVCTYSLKFDQWTTIHPLFPRAAPTQIRGGNSHAMRAHIYVAAYRAIIQLDSEEHFIDELQQERDRLFIQHVLEASTPPYVANATEKPYHLLRLAYTVHAQPEMYLAQFFDAIKGQTFPGAKPVVMLRPAQEYAEIGTHPVLRV